MDRLTCPVTGTTMAEAFGAEQRALQPLPTMVDSFDLVVTRPVSRSCLVSFEGRRYSVLIPIHVDHGFRGISISDSYVDAPLGWRA